MFGCSGGILSESDSHVTANKSFLWMAQPPIESQISVQSSRPPDKVSMFTWNIWLIDILQIQI